MFDLAAPLRIYQQLAAKMIQSRAIAFKTRVLVELRLYATLDGT